MLIDTHAHINLHAFKNDADEVLQRSFAVDVSVINVGTEYSTSKQAVTMLEQCPERVYAAIGLHPSHTYDNPYLDENESAFVTKREEFNYESYKQLALHPKVVGIGECGLDYYRLPEHELEGLEQKAIKELQKNAFLQQIKLAQELDKALIIHCRPSKESDDAYEDVIETISRVRHSESRRFGRGEESQSQEEILRSLSLSQNDGVRALRFEIHSFTGSPEVAQKFLDLGGYIGFNGIITFDKTGNMEQVVKAVPLERIVLETDSPYLAPTPYRGKRNEPVYIVEVAKKIAEWKSIGLEQLGATTTRNAQELFRLTWQDGG